MRIDCGNLHKTLLAADEKPPAWSQYTAEKLWNDEHISAQMLKYHLDPEAAPASRPHGFMDRSAAWIRDRFELGGGTRVLDLGCGPGLYASRFAATGAEVTGIDFSRRSIEYARQRATADGRTIRYINDNYLTFQPDGPADLITMIYCDFCALAPDQRQTLLGTVRETLAPGGAVLLDVFMLPAFAEREESGEFASQLMDGFWAPGEYFGFRRTFRYEAESVVLDKYTIVEPDSAWQVFNWLQYFSCESLENEFSTAGLNIVDRYGDVAGAPAGADAPVMAVVAERG